MIVIVEKNKDGKIVVTEEQLKQWLEEARAEGYREGQAGNTSPSLTWTPGTKTPNITALYEPAPWWTNPDIKPFEVTCGTTPDATTVPNSKITTNAEPGSCETAKAINYHGEPLESTLPDATQSSANEWFNSLVKDLSQNTLSNS